MLVPSIFVKLILTCSCLTILLAPTNTLARSKPYRINPYQQKAETLKALLDARHDDERLADSGQLDSLVDKQFDLDQLQIHARNKTKYLRLLNTDIEKIIGKRTRPGGIEDPHFPSSIRVKSHHVAAALDRKTLRPFMDLEGGDIHVDETSVDLLKTLTRDQLKAALDALAKVPVKVKWRDKKGRSRSGRKVLLNAVRFSHWDKTNAAGALALIAGARQESRLLTDMIALAPDAVMFELAGEAAAAVPIAVTANALIDIMSQLAGDNTKRIASSAANLVQVFIEYWADGDVDQQIYALTSLIYQSHKAMLNSDIVFSTKQLGVLLGALLAGSMLYAKKLKTADEQNLWAINSASNLIWAANSFLGIVPFAGSIAAALAGTISLAIVTWAVVYNKIGTRDFTPRILEVEGHIELSALEAAEAQSAERRLEMIEVLAWMESTIHVNGLHD